MFPSMFLSPTVGNFDFSPNLFLKPLQQVTKSNLYHFVLVLSNYFYIEIGQSILSNAYNGQQLCN